MPRLRMQITTVAKFHGEQCTDSVWSNDEQMTQAQINAHISAASTYLETSQAPNDIITRFRYQVSN